MIHQTSTAGGARRPLARPVGADALTGMTSLLLEGVARPVLGTVSEIVERMIAPAPPVLDQREEYWADAVSCGAHDCTCDCCIGDADIELYASVGERRIVPLVISNERCSPRRQALEICEPADGPKVRILGATEFELKGGERREVLLEVTTGGLSDGDHQPDDVTCCRVSYAEICLRGCDLRSVRLAIAVVPRRCLAYNVKCFCACC